MIVRPRISDFVRDTNKKYEPDTDIFCAICGGGIFYWYDIARDENDKICHQECLKEKQHGSDETG